MSTIRTFKKGGVPASAALKEPLSVQEQLAVWREKEGVAEGLVSLEIAGLFDGFEGFLDKLSNLLVGHDCLSEVDYTLRGFDGECLIFEVSGVLPCEPEVDSGADSVDEPSPPGGAPWRRWAPPAPPLKDARCGA